MVHRNLIVAVVLFTWTVVIAVPLNEKKITTSDDNSVETSPKTSESSYVYYKRTDNRTSDDYEKYLEMFLDLYYEKYVAPEIAEVDNKIDVQREGVRKMRPGDKFYVNDEKKIDDFDGAEMMQSDQPASPVNNTRSMNFSKTEIEFREAMRNR